MTPIDQVLNRPSTCLKWSRGSLVKHFREMTDASKVVIREKRVKNLQKDLITRDIHVKYQSSSTSKVISKVKVHTPSSRSQNNGTYGKVLSKL